MKLNLFYISFNLIISNIIIIKINNVFMITHELILHFKTRKENLNIDIDQKFLVNDFRQTKIIIYVSNLVALDYNWSNILMP